MWSTNCSVRLITFLSLGILKDRRVNDCGEVISVSIYVALCVKCLLQKQVQPRSQKY